MNDRDLLEAAAKAAGIEVLPFGRWPVGQEQFGLWIQVGEHRTAVGWWNPLTEDGDALRLAVKLGLDFYEGDDDGRAAYVGYYERTGNSRPQRFMVERHDARADPYTATRRAIVRAAAALGEKR